MTDPIHHNPAAPSAAGRVLRGYAPVAVLALLFVRMAALVPSSYVDDRAASVSTGAVGGNGVSGPEPGASGTTDGTVAPGGTEPGKGSPGQGSAAVGGGAPAATGGCPARG